MNTNWKAAFAIGIAAASGVGATYGALYFRVMHPIIQKPEPAKRRIACVGDSLTYGWGLMGAFRKYAYPALLQDKLGDDYQVMNYGICDRTLRDGQTGLTVRRKSMPGHWILILRRLLSYSEQMMQNRITLTQPDIGMT